jgi:uncharacterized protein
MIHPETELRYINHKKGRGVFATGFIPKGTVTYVKDALEIEIPPGDPRLENADYRQVIDTYTFMDPDGIRVLSWDHAKYVNHCCQCNTMSTGYGFEIAIRDIAPGEEITDEYGLFNCDIPMTLDCPMAPCRRQVCGRDLDDYYPEWDRVVMEALLYFHQVEQPLLKYLDVDVLTAVNAYLVDGRYQSVYALKYPRPGEADGAVCRWSVSANRPTARQKMEVVGDAGFEPATPAV